MSKNANRFPSTGQCVAVRTKNRKQSDTEVAGQTVLYGEGVVVEVVDGQMVCPLIHSFHRQHTVSQVLMSS